MKSFVITNQEIIIFLFIINSENLSLKLKDFLIISYLIHLWVLNYNKNKHIYIFDLIVDEIKFDKCFFFIKLFYFCGKNYLLVIFKIFDE